MTIIKDCYTALQISWLYWLNFVGRSEAAAHLRDLHSISVLYQIQSVCVPGVPPHHKSSVSTEVSETPGNCRETIILALFH